MVDIADRDEVVEAGVSVVVIKMVNLLMRRAGEPAEPAAPTIAVEHFFAHFLKHGIRFVAVMLRLLHAPLLAFDGQNRHICFPFQKGFGLCWRYQFHASHIRP